MKNARGSNIYNVGYTIRAKCSFKGWEIRDSKQSKIYIKNVCKVVLSTVKKSLFNNW